MPDQTPPLVDTPALVRYGWPELVRGDAPAAGAMFTKSIDGSFVERLISVHVRLVTDANVAARNVMIEYRDEADNRFDLSGAAVTQAASGTNDWIFSVFAPAADWTVNASAIIPLHGQLLLPTWSWRIYVENIQVGDQLSRVRFVRERFYTYGDR